VITGADDWNIYCWKIAKDYEETPVEGQSYARTPATDEAFAVLEGHRSIVNHCRHSEKSNVIVSSGVEKIVKVWSGVQLPASIRDPPRRAEITIQEHRERMRRHFQEARRNRFDDYVDDLEEEDADTLATFDAHQGDSGSDDDDDVHNLIFQNEMLDLGVIAFSLEGSMDQHDEDLDSDDDEELTTDASSSSEATEDEDASTEASTETMHTALTSQADSSADEFSSGTTEGEDSSRDDGESESEMEVEHEGGEDTQMEQHSAEGNEVGTKKTKRKSVVGELQQNGSTSCNGSASNR